MARDGHIRLLPLHIANKIAAGEVVERPASVVKELVENSIDAGASRVEIAITAGGRNLVSVRDDGCGMTRADALLSLERQATSKIRDVDDILRIDTLGFRGEAIPSIAAVSRFTMTTRRASDESGVKLQVNAGVLAEVRDTGAPPGTSIEVRDLFCNVPARRKFLRAYSTEEAAVRHVFTVVALSRPDIGFSLSCDGRETGRLPKGDTLEDRIRTLFGADFASSLIPVSGVAGGVEVSGYVERPDKALPVRRDQYIFVNGRPATSPVITAAVRDAMPRADARARSGAFLFITIPCSQVDVNVHPAKREVRFHKPGDVRAALMNALGKALSGGGTAADAAVRPSLPQARQAAAPVPAPADPVAPAPVPAPLRTPFVAPFSSDPSARTAIPSRSITLPQPVAPEPPEIRRQTPPPETVTPDPPPDSSASTPQRESAAHAAQPAAASAAPSLAPFRASPPPPPPAPSAVQRPRAAFLAQMTNGYLLFETDGGLVTVSPRAARERILYEKLAAGPDKIVSQPLLVPDIVHLPPADSARIRANLDIAANLGFSLEQFGANTWKVEAVPAAGDGFPAREMLLSMAADFSDGRMRRDGGRWREETAARACARVCAGRKIPYTPEAAEKLMADLSACRMPYVSPDGAPTMILTSNRDLERRFAK